MIVLFSLRWAYLVVVGLFVYLMLSRSGPLGVLELLYTPTAMIIAQCILIVPIVTSLTYQIIEELNREYRDLFQSPHQYRKGDFCVPLGRAFLVINDCPRAIWSRDF